MLELDRDAGRVKPVESVAVGGMVMPLAVSPDKRVLYAALRSQPFRVVSLAIDPASGRWLFAASYPGHKVTVNSIDAQGVVGAIQQLVPTSPNAHAIHADAANRFVLATSLGGDHLSVWRLDAAKGRLTPNDPPLAATAQKAGPRHFVWDKAQRYVSVVNELDASVCVFAWDAARGSMRELQRTSALPPGFSGKPWAADLHLTPDGRFLYASERTSSTLTAFRVDAEKARCRPSGRPAPKRPRAGLRSIRPGATSLPPGRSRTACRSMRSTHRPGSWASRPGSPWAGTRTGSRSSTCPEGMAPIEPAPPQVLARIGPGRACAAGASIFISTRLRPAALAWYSRSSAAL